MLQELNVFTASSTSPADVVASLVVAGLCGLLIALVYRWTYRGPSYAPTLVRSMVFLTMITAVVMLVIGDNLARAFGLVGAMSIIRFRTALKDPQDIVFVFFALAIGLAAGVGLFKVAVLSTLLISLAMVATTYSDFGVVHKRSHLLQLTVTGPQEPPPYLAVLKTHCRRFEQINARTTEPDGALQLTFYVDFRRGQTQQDLAQALDALPTVSWVNIYRDTEQL